MFRRFVDYHLAPVLRPADVVVMVNLGAHHATGIRGEIEAVGATVLYMPPHLPVDRVACDARLRRHSLGVPAA